MHNQQRPGLEATFTEENPRHDRMAGIMPTKKIRRWIDIRFGNDPLGLDLDDFIDEQERRAMRY
jgi:hypothetical protein